MVDFTGLIPKHYQITAEGMKILESELADLKRKRREIAQNIQDITSQNTNISAQTDSVFALNQNHATELNNQIELLERILGLAEVIDKPVAGSPVQIGSRVAVVLNGKEHDYLIVSPIEADPDEGKVSNESPLGQSLLGKKINEPFEVRLPTSREIRGKVKSIS